MAAVSFFFITSFIGRDATGEITVITNRPMPRKGDGLKVMGAVKGGFPIGDGNLYSIMEKEQ